MIPPFVKEVVEDRRIFGKREKIPPGCAVLPLAKGESFLFPGRKKPDLAVVLLAVRLRTHLENISARDTSQFPHHQEATTKVYLDGTPRRGDAGGAEIGRIPSGCGDFLVPRRCGFAGVAQATPSLPRLADTKKLHATRAGDIFKMGSELPEENCATEILFKYNKRHILHLWTRVPPRGTHHNYNNDDNDRD